MYNHLFVHLSLILQCERDLRLTREAAGAETKTGKVLTNGLCKTELVGPYTVGVDVYGITHA